MRSRLMQERFRAKLMRWLWCLAIDLLHDDVSPLMDVDGPVAFGAGLAASARNQAKWLPLSSQSFPVMWGRLLVLIVHRDASTFRDYARLTTPPLSSFLRPEMIASTDVV